MTPAQKQKADAIATAARDLAVRAQALQFDLAIGSGARIVACDAKMIATRMADELHALSRWPGPTPTAEEAPTA